MCLYGTHAIDNYQDGNVFFTEKGNKIYAIALMEDGKKIPKTISWSKNIPSVKAKIKLLDTGKNLDYKLKNGRVEVNVPDSVRSKENSSALVFFMEK